MFVACPHCGFLVAATSAGPVRCPRCGSPIDAKQAKRVETPRRGQPAAAREAAPTPHDAAAEATVAPSATGAATPPPSRTRRAPSFLRRHAPAPVHRNGWRAYLVLAGLTLLLLLQVLLSQRDALAANARWRPLVGGLCGLFRCDVPAWREPGAFTMLQRSVQPKAGVPGVLHVNASFRNDARWPQPWPTVLLTLSDMEGRQVGLRAFRPDEYRNGRTGAIAPGQSATIQLDVVEPAQQVVAFTFDFL